MSDKQTKLKNRHTVLDSILETVPNAVIICEARQDASIVVLVNKFFTLLTGYVQEDVENMQTEMFFGKLADDESAQKAILAVQNGMHFEEEFLLRKKNGETARSRFICAPVCDEDGAFVYCVVYLKDIAYKNEMDYLADAYKKKSDLLVQYKEAIDVSTIVSKTNKKGIITYVNKNFCDTSGYSADELVGKPHSMVRHPDMSKETFDVMWQTILQKKVWKGVVKNRQKDGGSYFVDATIVPILNQDGEIEEFIAIRHDVTEEVLAKQEAQKSLAQRSDFFGKASHELRTPLNIVINFTENLKEDFDEINKDEEITEDAKKFIERIDKNAKYLLTLIDDILDIANIENNAQPLEYSKENLQSLLNDVHSSFAAVIKNNVLFELKLASEPLFVDTNKRLLTQILLNLLSNASKFTSNGMIKIELKKEDKNAVISVVDTGRGIPKEKLDIIFEPFMQANRNDEGTGLGLKLVKEFCSALDIDLKIESEMGVGTTFTMRMKTENGL